MTETTTAQTLPDYPTRADSTLLAVPGTSDYATADGRFYVRRRYETAVTSGGYAVTDTRSEAYRVSPEYGYEHAATVDAARNIVATVVDREYRAQQIAYTSALAATDAIFARRVERLRESAAVHGRVTGSVGAYWSESDPRLGELVVFVERAEYASVLADDDRHELDANDRHTDNRSATLDDYAGELADAQDALADSTDPMSRLEQARFLIAHCPLLSALIDQR